MSLVNRIVIKLIDNKGKTTPLMRKKIKQALKDGSLTKKEFNEIKAEKKVIYDSFHQKSHHIDRKIPQEKPGRVKTSALIDDSRNSTIHFSSSGLSKSLPKDHVPSIEGHEFKGRKYKTRQGHKREKGILTESGDTYIKGDSGLSSKATTNNEKRLQAAGKMSFLKGPGELTDAADIILKNDKKLERLLKMRMKDDPLLRHLVGDKSVSSFITTSKGQKYIKVLFATRWARRHSKKIAAIAGLGAAGGAAYNVYKGDKND